MEEQRKITKKYSNGEVTIVWQPHLCVHSTICFRGLPNVFDPRKRPWVTPEHAESETIMKQIDACPSGALSYLKETNEDEDVEVSNETIVEATKNGPLLVYGNISIKDHAGNFIKKNKVTALCRCGASDNKPFCDGSHTKINFEG
ncbi:(4Fe-4S)-binding protein [Emticicia sp. SJ17W-69]|uniref:(4Fe-4S)-binding protein n=1 Tax=Emticicia sp. SJ17W-69 TaxID=3421657 RepID=UPI003EB76FDA